MTTQWFSGELDWSEDEFQNISREAFADWLLAEAGDDFADF
jgi:hypothetical protein